MKRFWVSWFSGNYADEGYSEPPFQFWVTGCVSRPNYGMNAEIYAEFIDILEEQGEDMADDFVDKHGRDDCTLCAVIDANSEDEIWQAIGKYFPDYKQRFIDEWELHEVPGKRFSDFENRTKL